MADIPSTRASLAERVEWWARVTIASWAFAAATVTTRAAMAWLAPVDAGDWRQIYVILSLSTMAVCAWAALSAVLWINSAAKAMSTYAWEAVPDDVAIAIVYFALFLLRLPIRAINRINQNGYAPGALVALMWVSLVATYLAGLFQLVALIEDGEYTTSLEEIRVGEIVVAVGALLSVVLYAAVVQRITGRHIEHADMSEGRTYATTGDALDRLKRKDQ